MAGFKISQPGLRFSGEKVTADEQDDYNVYSISNPGTHNFWYGVAGSGGTSETVAYTLTNRFPDYPRNLLYSLAGSNASMGGTWVINGQDQFGSSITETMVLAGSTNGGTKIGTQIFARVDSGTFYGGTYVGHGTPSLGFVPGTACLFGLPVKIAGTGDIAFLSMTNGTGVISYNGGTVAAYINSTVHAIQPAGTLSGSETINVWVKPSYVPDNIAKVANLKIAA